MLSSSGSNARTYFYLLKVDCFLEYKSRQKPSPLYYYRELRMRFQILAKKDTTGSNANGVFVQKDNYTKSVSRNFIINQSRPFQMSKSLR